MVRVVSAVLAAVMWLSAQSADATVVLDQPLPELTRRTPLIVRGTVESQQSTWDEDHRRIVTLTRVRVLETMRGSPAPAVITVRQPGGVVDGIGQHVEGTAQFNVAEEVVLFLEPHGSTKALFNLNSLAASKFAVVRQNSKVKLVRDVSGLTLMTRDASGVIKDLAATPMTTTTFEELRTAIKNAGPLPSTPAGR